MSIMKKSFNPEKEILDYCDHIMHAHVLTLKLNRTSKTWYWDYPAMASICHNIQCTRKRSGFAHCPRYTMFHPNLASALYSLGTIGKKSLIGERYIIGQCAEQHAANHYMKGYGENDLANLYFSSARRPRTKQRFDPCANCRSVFPNI